MSPTTREALDSLVTAVRAGPKYRHLCETLVRRVGAAELEKRAGFKAAVKATRNKLHQVAGVYQTGEARYGRWLGELEMARAQGDEAFAAACAGIMQRHASTRERLRILDRFYRETLAGLPPIRTVLDVACGLNPLSLPWMPVGEALEAYIALDVYEDLAQFLEGFFALAGAPGRAEARDVLDGQLLPPADLVLVLKALPCLQQIDPGSAERLLTALNAPFLLVSFPAASLSGRNKGMVENYERRFREMAAGQPGWQIRRHEFPTELAILVLK